jgi:hypothetical protein
MTPHAGKVWDRRKNPPDVLCQCPALARHKMKIFSSAWLEPTDIRRALIKKLLAIAFRTGLFRRALARAGVVV